MYSLVNRKFAEWTEGLDPHQSRIAIFTHIRDIPYSLEGPRADPGREMEQLLSRGRGSCGAKHYLLAEMFRRLGLNVIYATFAFSWNDPDLHYPPSLRELSACLPVIHHLACRVQIGRRWALVDATWDPPLAKAGFPVNLNWDGYAATKCAVKPLPSPHGTVFCRPVSQESHRTGEVAEICPLDGEEDHWGEEGREAYHSGKRARVTADEIERIHRFNREFSSWLETVRENAGD